jgi:hypothetical protein
MSIDIFQYFLLMQGAHLLALTRILKSHPFPIEMLQEKEYFCPDPQLDFSGKCDSFRTLGCMTNDSHQEQMGAGFSSLQVEILAFWLRGRRNPQEASIKK